MIELKLCPLVHKGSWGETPEADGNFPNEKRGNPEQERNKCSGLTNQPGTWKSQDIHSFIACYAQLQIIKQKEEEINATHLSFHG